MISNVVHGVLLGRGLLSARSRRWILGVSGAGAAGYAACFAWQAGASVLRMGLAWHGGYPRAVLDAQRSQGGRKAEARLTAAACAGSP